MRVVSAYLLLVSRVPSFYLVVWLIRLVDYDRQVYIASNRVCSSRGMCLMNLVRTLIVRLRCDALGPRLVRN